jgi:hypothetical protein
MAYSTSPGSLWVAVALLAMSWRLLANARCGSDFFLAVLTCKMKN